MRKAKGLVLSQPLLVAYEGGEEDGRKAMDMMACNRNRCSCHRNWECYALGSRSEQVRVKQILQEVQQLEQEEPREKQEAIMKYGPPTGR